MVCGFYETRLSRPQFTEIVSLNVRQKIQSIVLLNFSHYAELFPDFDTPFSKTIPMVGQRRRSSNHLDFTHRRGCSSSVYKICPVAVFCKQLQRYHLLWENINSTSWKQLASLSTDDTEIFIDERKLKVYVRTWFFISDSPAKSLFMTIINFNGYFACTSCKTKGISKRSSAISGNNTSIGVSLLKDVFQCDSFYLLSSFLASPVQWWPGE